MNKTVLVTGSLAFDLIMDFKGSFSEQIMPDKIHQINLSFLLDNLKKQKGGTAGNIAYNLALLNSEVSILASAGNDFLEYGEFLKQAGVDISNIQIVSDKTTATAFIMTDLADNQITGFYPGAMSEAANLSLKDLNPKPRYVVISPNDPKAIMKLAAESREEKIPFMADIGMQLPTLSAEDIKNIIKGADILIGNDYEISLLKEKSGLSESDLFEQVKIIITTLGSKGAEIKTLKETIMIEPAKIAEVLDPTGAGDAFRAGFLAGYLKDLDLKTSSQMGAVAACYAIEKYGTTTHKFSIEEFKKRYLESFGEKLELR